MTPDFRHDDRFHWTDPDVAQETVRLLLWPHTLSLSNPGDRLDGWMWSRRLRNIAVNDIAYGADVTVVPGRLESFYAVIIPLAGTSVIRCGHQEVHAEIGLAAVVTPSQPLSMRWSADCTQRVIRIEQPALEAHLAEMLGFPLGYPLTFDLSMTLGNGDAQIFAEEVSRLVSLLDRDTHAFDRAVAATDVEQLLMTRLLQGAHHNYADQLAARDCAELPRAVRTAVDLIESHPEWPHTVGSLAVTVGLSRRSLERAFRKYKGMSPWKYVKSVRLRRARDQLRAAHPADVTVRQVAHRWGMTHSQFSTEYRRLYGETPTETLKRPQPPRADQ